MKSKRAHIQECGNPNLPRLGWVGLSWAGKLLLLFLGTKEPGKSLARLSPLVQCFVCSDFEQVRIEMFGSVGEELPAGL